MRFKMLFLSIGLLFIGSLSTFSQANKMTDGQTYLAQPSERQILLNTGIQVGLDMATSIVNRMSRTEAHDYAPILNISFRLAECLGRENKEQLRAVIVHWIREHPEEWHLPLSDQILDALTTAAVCTKE